LYQRCISGYERRQRHWALGIEHDHESNDDVLEDDFVEPGPEVPQNAPEVVHNPRNCMVCLTTTPGENDSWTYPRNTFLRYRFPVQRFSPLDISPSKQGYI